MKASPKAAPDTAPSRRGNLRWYVVGFVVAAALLAASTYLALERTMFGWEYSIFAFVNNWPDSFRTFFLMATIAPESLWIGAISVVVTFVLKMYHLSWRLAASIFIGFGMVYGLKEVVARERPLGLLDTGIHTRASETAFGFPSSHVMMITLVMLCLLPYLPGVWRWLLMGLIPLVALSRLYLGVHAPLDIVGGFAVGLLVVSGLRILPGKVREWFRLE